MKQRKTIVLFIIMAMFLLAGCFLLDKNRSEEETVKNPINVADEILPEKQENEIESVSEEVAEMEAVEIEAVEIEESGLPMEDSSNKSSVGFEPAVAIRVSQDEIVNRYQMDFDALKEEAETLIYALIEDARQEYYSLEEAERTIGFKLELANRYLKAGNNLEKSIDLEFYDILSAMESELLSMEYETNVLKEIEKSYKSEKSVRRKELVSKAMGKL